MKRSIKSVIGLFSMMLVTQSVWVHAAETPKIFMEVADYHAGERSLDVSCKMENGDNVTNGKLRIFYDAEKLTLTPSEAGDALSGTMLEVNDCLTGNKPEGEMVVAFASAESIPSDGSLLDMGFKLKDGVKEGDEITFQVKAEKLSGDNGDLEKETPEIVYTVGKEQAEKPGGQDNDKKNQNKTDNDKKPSSNSGGKSSTKKGSVKTGDETPVAAYLLLGAGAVAVLAGCTWTKKNKQ